MRQRCGSQLLRSNQTSLDGLAHRLLDETAFDIAGLYQIKDGPEGASKSEPLSSLYIVGSEIRVMQDQNTWDVAVPAEAPGHCHVQLGGVEV